MTIATWNVNGIRARQAQVQEWVEREQPDIVCLQEIKAGSDQVPAALCEMEGYWCYWHGAKGYSGVALHVSKTLRAGAPGVRAPGVRLREPHRDRRASRGLTVASVYVPNGGKDFPREDAVSRGARAVRRASRTRRAQPLVICGDMNIARTDMDVHPKERKPRAIGQLPEERALLEADHRARAGRHGPRARARTTIRCSPGGRRGGTCVSATSAGGSTTCWPARASSIA